MDKYHQIVTSRLISKLEINKKTGCWEWRATISLKGYGQIRYKNNTIHAHRLSYIIFIGPLTPGLELDHLCRNKKCVNPYHLEEVTHQENCKRGDAGKYNKIKTHCPQGHEYTKENTIIDRGSRLCRECRRIQSINNYYKNTLLDVRS